MISQMFNNYLTRTNTHINNVQKVWNYLNKNNSFELFNVKKIDIDFIISCHDQTKLEKEEMIGYILMTEKYGRKCGYKFTDEDQKTMDEAWIHHYKNNPHHPEYWENIEEMHIRHLFEMCCDWGAMSYEFGDSVVKFKDEKAYTKHNFTYDQKVVIDYICDKIEEGLKNGSI